MLNVLNCANFNSNEFIFSTAGLSDTEIKQLTVAAIEGLDSDVIPVIPVNVLKVIAHITTYQTNTMYESDNLNQIGTYHVLIV